MVQGLAAPFVNSRAAPFLRFLFVDSEPKVGRRGLDALPKLVDKDNVVLDSAGFNGRSLRSLACGVV